MTLLRDLRAHLLAVDSLLVLEARERPERRTRHLVEKGRDLVRRIEGWENEYREGGEGVDGEAITDGAQRPDC